MDTISLNLVQQSQNHFKHTQLQSLFFDDDFKFFELSKSLEISVN